jgi:hypothetical protein
MYNTPYIEYHRMYSEDYMTLIQDVNTRIDAVSKIINDITIESNKQIWYNDLEKYYIVKNMIINKNFDNLVIYNCI